LLTTVKIVAVAPIPTPSIETAAKVNKGALESVRTAWRISAIATFHPLPIWCDGPADGARRNL
jgi:hypothetical protein